MSLIKFLSDPQGNFSNSRLIADIMIGFAMLLSIQIIIIGVQAPEILIMNIALQVSAIFSAIAGPALIFLFGQKKTEAKVEVQAEINQSTEPSEITQV